MQITKISHTLLNLFPSKTVYKKAIAWKDEEGNVVKTEVIRVDVYNKAGKIQPVAELGKTLDTTS